MKSSKKECENSPKDNTITIKPVTETWDDILDSFITTAPLNKRLSIHFTNYLEKNYQVPKKK